MDGCVFATGVCVVLLAIGTLRIRVRTRRLAASRPGETFDTFRLAFAPGEAPPEALRAVYATFQEWRSDAAVAFPVRADDDIGRVFGMAGEDLDDAVLEVLSACGRVPPKEQLRHLQPIVTVRDFVRFVDGCPSTPDQTLHPPGGA